MQKRPLGPGITFFPQPAVWIVTADPSGLPNLMTASWVGLASKTPPTLAVSLHEGRQTYANLQRSGCFTANLIPVSLVAAGDYCGLVSGRNADKLAVSGLTLSPASRIDALQVTESPLTLECRVSGETAIGEYRLVLGEVLEIHASTAACRADGSLDAAAFDPLVYLGGIREYWSLGHQVGTAYSDGKALLRS